MENRKLQGRTTESRTESTPKTKRESWFIRKGKNLLLAAGLATGLALGAGACSSYKANQPADAGVCGDVTYETDDAGIVKEVICLPQDKCKLVFVRDAGPELDGGVTFAPITAKCVPITQEDASVEPSHDAGTDSDGATAFTVSANYQNSFGVAGYPDHFATNVGMTSAFTISVSSGAVLSGDPNNMPDNGYVCPNAQIVVTPQVTGTYVVTSIYSPYPADGGGYLGYVSPPLPCSNPGGATHTIYWFDDSTFDGQRNDALSNGEYYYGSSYLSPLGGSGSFYDECMTYDNLAYIYWNRQGGGRVFGKGIVSFQDDSSQFHSTSLSNPAASSTYTLNTLGAHHISATVSGIDSMAVVLKYPMSDNFRLYYFVYDTPSIAPATLTKTINVQYSASCGPGDAGVD